MPNHRIELVVGPALRAVSAEPDYQRGYDDGWNACLTATEEAHGTGDIYRCTCGFECRDFVDADDHLHTPDLPRRRPREQDDRGKVAERVNAALRQEARVLATLGLQSPRYDQDRDYHDAVDNVLGLT